MLIVSVVIYLAVTIAIGLLAARYVRNSTDYLVAGRSLPLYMNTATVFATWFGAETVLSVPAHAVARAFYRMDLLPIGDFYKKRYGRPAELITSVAITASYLGWTSAPVTALGVGSGGLSGGGRSR